MHYPSPQRTGKKSVRKPSWLKRPLSHGSNAQRVKRIIGDLRLTTVCGEARCPNAGECFSNSTATFMLLGDHCTRNCRFCAVGHGSPCKPDTEEPLRIAEAAERLGLRHVVITSVTRDDLPDGGAAQFAAVVRAVRERIHGVTVEVLVPDFQGSEDALRTVIAARPDVINHNVETVPRLYSIIRPDADYERSLRLLARTRELAPNIVTKSGLMVGLGETMDEVRAVLGDLNDIHCAILTIGQYLQPSPEQVPVERYLSPDEFAHLKTEALDRDFAAVASGPYVRSSYHAGELFSVAHIAGWCSFRDQKNQRA